MAILSSTGGLEERGAACAQSKRLTKDFLPIAHDLLLIWDSASVIATAYLCAAAYSALGAEQPLSVDLQSEAGRLVLLGALLAPFTFARRDMFSFERMGLVVPLASATAVRAAVLLALIFSFAFLTRSFDALPRSWVIAWSFAILACAVGARLALGRYLSGLERRGVLRERVAIVGAKLAVDRLLAHLLQTKPRGIEVVGAFDAGADPLGALVALGQKRGLDTVIVALPERDARLILEITRELKALDLDIVLCPHELGAGFPLGRGRDFAGTSMWLLAHRPIQRWGTVFKTTEDRLVSALMLFVLLPLLLTVSAAIRLDSPGPILFRQRRHGWNNTEFEVFKFRTMTWSPGIDTGGAQQTRRGDGRVTRVGRFLRMSSIDELPQLLNVLLGDMSLVGPRPHPVVMRTEDMLGHEIVAEYAHRHRVKPGITGWAQVNGYRGATSTAEQVRKRIEHDIYYIENWSVLFDLKILALTPLKLVFDTGNAF